MTTTETTNKPKRKAKRIPRATVFRAKGSNKTIRGEEIAAVVKYLRDHWFRFRKFVTINGSKSFLTRDDSTWASVACKVGVVKGLLPKSSYFSTNQWVYDERRAIVRYNHCFLPALSQLRQQKASMARRNYLEDMKNDKVPSTFPGSLVMTYHGDENGNRLHPDYRRYDDNFNEEFVYFMTRIMPVFSDGLKKFNARSGKDLLSEIYSVSDEAFGLVVLFNELHCWEEAWKNRNATGETEVKKKSEKEFESYNSDWPTHGKQFYNCICYEVQARRKESQSSELEEALRFEFSNRCGRLRQRR